MQTLNPLKHKKIIFSLIIFLGLVYLINSYVLKSVLTVTIGNSVSSQKIVLKITDVNGKEAASKELSGSNEAQFRLPLGSFNVSAVQAESETLAYAKLGRFKGSSIGLDLVPQRAVDKIGSESLGCDTYSNGSLFSYGCGRGSLILKHLNKPGQITNPVPLLSGAQQLPITVSLNNGLLAKFNEASDLFYLGFVDLANEKVARIEAPKDINLQAALTITDKVNQNQRFLLINHNGDVYSFRDINDRQAEHLKLPENKKLKQPTELLAKSYSLFNDQLIVYVGKSQEFGDHEEAINARDKLERGFIYLANLATPGNNWRVIELPPTIDNNDIHYLDSSHFAVLKGDGLSIYQFDEKSTSLKAAFSTTDVKVAAGGSGIWFTKNNAIYKYEIASNQAKKVFESAHLVLSNIFKSAEAVTFNAFIANDDSNILHSYRLTDQVAAGPRLEDKLPYTLSSDLPVFKTEYSGNRITFQLALASISSDRQTGQLSYDQAEFEAARQKVIERLQQDGFDVTKLELYFTI